MSSDTTFVPFALTLNAPYLGSMHPMRPFDFVPQGGHYAQGERWWKPLHPLRPFDSAPQSGRCAIKKRLVGVRNYAAFSFT
jgi:hypothetical protein